MSKETNFNQFKKIKKRLTALGTIEAVVVSGSMEPLIKTNQLIRINPVQIEKLKMFDIIVFWDGERLICHFIWKINSKNWGLKEKRLITRSLISFRDDFPVETDKVLGVVSNEKIGVTTKLVILANHFWHNS